MTPEVARVGAGREGGAGWRLGGQSERGEPPPPRVGLGHRGDEAARLVTGGTDNHMMLIDLTPRGPGLGVFLQDALDRVGITVNKNTIPGEPSSALYPSGVRLGTPAATTRGMREAEMDRLAEWIAAVGEEIKEFRLPKEPGERAAQLNEFRRVIQPNARLARIHEQVRDFCLKFPVPGTA